MEIDLTKVDVEGEGPALISAGDSVFLRDEFARSRHHSVTDFADLRALETFINHVHFPFRDDRQSLLEAVEYSASLQKCLCEYSAEKKFVILMCVSDRRCTVRFHQARTNETWLADDLDSYHDEAVMVLTT
jgi:hypothetical protein